MPLKAVAHLLILPSYFLYTFSTHRTLHFLIIQRSAFPFSHTECEACVDGEAAKAAEKTLHPPVTGCPLHTGYVLASTTP